ncbi:MAG: PorT family protein [Ignavibacteriaceae bacterium]|jgi:hypothetical protein|nr:PorT family protein [Ignavibacteriaceae bacterium]
MKKLYILFIIIFALAQSAFPQTVDSIKIEQAGDKILIHYKIMQSNDLQGFKVTLSCFLSTGIKLEPKSITGDVGESVTGGKANYMIAWDVLKDLEELQSAEFSVKAELVKGNPTHIKGVNLTGWDKKRFHIMLESDFPGPKFGLMIGYMGKWGISASFLYGKIGLNKHREGHTYPPTSVPYIGLDLSKRIVNRNNVQMHILAGPSFLKALVYDKPTMDFYTKNVYGFNLGLALDVKRFSISIGTAQFPVVVESEYRDIILDYSSHGYFNAGIGLRF